jgi:hypothetical protein
MHIEHPAIWGRRSYAISTARAITHQGSLGLLPWNSPNVFGSITPTYHQLSSMVIP